MLDCIIVECVHNIDSSRCWLGDLFIVCVHWQSQYLVLKKKTFSASVRVRFFAVLYFALILFVIDFFIVALTPSWHQNILKHIKISQAQIACHLYVYLERKNQPLPCRNIWIAVCCICCVLDRFFFWSFVCRCFLEVSISVECDLLEVFAATEDYSVVQANLANNKPFLIQFRFKYGDLFGEKRKLFASRNPSCMANARGAPETTIQV